MRLDRNVGVVGRSGLRGFFAERVEGVQLHSANIAGAGGSGWLAHFRIAERASRTGPHGRIHHRSFRNADWPGPGIVRRSPTPNARRALTRSLFRPALIP